VKEITEENQGIDLRLSDQFFKTAAIILRGRLGYWNTRFTKSRRFSKMGIGNQKKLLGRPMDSLCGPKLQLFTMPSNYD
jgi:hypothetical protein